MIVSAFKSLSRLAIRQPKRMLLLAALVTLAALPGVFRLKLRTDGHALIPSSAPEVVTDERIRANFGLRDQIVILIRPGGTNDIYNPATLQLVRDLTAECKKLAGVGPADVLSLATEPSFRLRPGTVIQQTMLEPALVAPPELSQLRDDLRRIELYTGTLVSLDGKSTVILVGVPEGVNRAGFFARIRQIISAQKPASDRISVTGAPVAESLFGVQILEDLGVPGALLGGATSDLSGNSPAQIPASLHELRVFVARHFGLMPLAALVMMFVLLVWFRKVLAALLPLPGVAATMLVVFGLMGWLGVPIYLTTAAMPVLLIVISVTNDIYLFNRYFTLLREKPGANHVALVEETFEKLARPVACTSFAAVAGFLSFGFSPLAPVKAFGFFTGLGALTGLGLSFTVVPALLVLTNPDWLRPRAVKSEKPVAAPLAAGLAGLGLFVVRHRWAVIGGALLIIALTPLGLRRLVVQDSWLNGFDPESEFRRVTQEVNDDYFGMHLLYVCAEAPKLLTGELPASAVSRYSISLPDDLIRDPVLIMGSPVTLSTGGDSAVWRPQIELAIHNAKVLLAPLVGDGPETNFWSALKATGQARFEIPVRTQLQPELIRQLGGLAAFIREQRQDAVGGVLGPEDYLTTTRFMLRPDSPQARTLPDDARGIKTLWDYYAVALGPERLRQLADSNYEQSVTTIFLKDANFVDTARLLRAIHEYEQTKLAPRGIKLSLAGDVAVSQSLIRGIVSTQLQSLFWSLVGIFLVTAFIGGSWRWGILCLLPSLLAVVIKFAVMGWADIPLGVATSMFAAMTLGIGVNCAIHLLEGFDQARPAGKSRMDALSQALRLTGPPALANTLAISLGFGALTLSQVPANARLGILLVLGLTNCFLVSVLLLPVLLHWWPLKESRKPGSRRQHN